MSKDTKAEVLKETKVCTGCGVLKPGSAYTACRTKLGKYQLMPKCKACRSAAELEFRRQGGARTRLTKQVSHQELHQQRSLERARNNRKEWTGPELELLARRELTEADLAERLGRTVFSVRRMRAKILHDPRKRDLAGAPGSIQAAS